MKKRIGYFCVAVTMAIAAFCGYQAYADFKKLEDVAVAMLSVRSLTHYGLFHQGLDFPAAIDRVKLPLHFTVQSRHVKSVARYPADIVDSAAFIVELKAADFFWLSADSAKVGTEAVANITADGYVVDIQWVCGPTKAGGAHAYLLPPFCRDALYNH